MLTFCLSVFNEKKSSKKKAKNKKAQQEFFEEIYWKYHIDVYKRVCSLCQDTDAAQDIMQETWLSVINYIDHLKGKEEYVIKSFIMKTAKYRTKRFLQTKEKEKRRFIYDFDEMENFEDSDLLEECESNGVEEVLKCIQMLSETQRDILNLYYIHEFTPKEIALQLNLSERVVISRLHRGKERLLALLKERGFE